MTRLARPAALFAPLALLAAGCGDPVATVSGRVTLKGEPVADAALAFQPTAEGADPFPGGTRETGAYHVTYRGADGMPPGKYRVTVTRYTLRGGKPLPAGEAGAAVKGDGKALAEIYAFEKDIAPGPNTLDFELTQGTRVKE